MNLELSDTQKINASYVRGSAQVYVTGFPSESSSSADVGGVPAFVTAVTPDGASSSSGITVVVTLEGP